jgi:hypothetical protein
MKKKQDNDSDILLSQELLSSRIKVLTLKNKEERHDQILNILQSGASDQIKYMIGNNDFQNLLIREEERDFFDV